MMKSPTPSVSILAIANDGEIDKALRELFNLRFMLIKANKTSPMW